MPLTPSSPLTDTVELRGIPVFHAGSYPQGEFDVSFLQALADAYDPSFHEAPNYLAHEDDVGRRPGGNLAFGWIKNLYLKGQTLFADLVAVPRLFAELVLAGRLKKRSVELYADLNGKGPYLRALAWPMIPQVKHLADVHPTQIFTEKTESFLSVPFSEKELPMTQDPSPFVTRDELSQLLADLKNELVGEQKKLAAVAAVRTFCDQMVQAGKMTPAEQVTEEPLLVAQAVRELTENFAEGQTPLSRQRMDFFRNRAPVVNLGVPAQPVTDDKPAPDDQKTVRYFTEHKDFFTRLNVTIDDLLEAEKITRTRQNPLVTD